MGVRPSSLYNASQIYVGTDPEKCLCLPCVLILCQYTILTSSKTRQPGTSAYKFQDLIGTVVNFKMEKVLEKHSLVQWKKNPRLRGEPVVSSGSAANLIGDPLVCKTRRLGESDL